VLVVHKSKNVKVFANFVEKLFVNHALKRIEYDLKIKKYLNALAANENFTSKGLMICMEI